MKANDGLGALLEKLAPKHGFPLSGALDLDAAMPALAEHARRYDTWIGRGYQGTMRYLDRGRGRRADPRAVFPEARGVFCVAAPYGPRDGDEHPDDPADGASYARYLRGRDYHAVMKERLAALLAEAAAVIPFEYKVCCDTSAVLERSLAHFAGLGWIGKNTCLIHPALGSYLFLAEAFLSVSPGGVPRPMRDHCGTCRACLDACPTSAFPETGVLDATRCVSYWTLEHRAPFVPSNADLDGARHRIAGCDVCQEVCPYNRKPRPALWPEWNDRDADATFLRAWEDLLTESEDEYAQRVARSALSWVKPAHFARNLAYAVTACARDWAPARRAGVRLLVEQRLRDERDENARQAWSRCVAALGE
ncbi:MAG: tRNA epoxyqueuosine(34) reductase QueG [Deltaproteobacteria bacterium]|nr:tRNA epoxyqueuosine(34) reductase QueG [Deltaproteobacteria bacterium]